MERRCYIHVGTHKTGTTKLQDALALNSERFAEANVLVARSGNQLPSGNPGYVGNHNLAFEMLGDARFRPEFGTLADLTAELLRSPHKDALISCEDFSLMHVCPERFDLLRDACLEAGYRPLVIVYLREQAAYAQSLYAMFVRRGRFSIDFEEFLEVVFSKSDEFAMALLPFEYERILDPLVACFGAANVIVRPYRAYCGDDFLVRDFVSLIETEDAIDAASFAPNPRLNEAGRYRDVLHALHERRSERRPDLDAPDVIANKLGVIPSLLDEPYYALEPKTVRRFREHFAESNARIRERFGVEIEPHEPLPLAEWDARERLLAACTRAWKIAS